MRKRIRVMTLGARKHEPRYFSVAASAVLVMRQVLDLPLIEPEKLPTRQGRIQLRGSLRLERREHVRIRVERQADL